MMTICWVGRFAMKRRRWRSLVESEVRELRAEDKGGHFSPHFAAFFRTSVVPIIGPRWHTVFTVCRRGPRGWGQCTGTGPSDLHTVYAHLRLFGRT